jgi:hypothetical protein
MLEIPEQFLSFIPEKTLSLIVFLWWIFNFVGLRAWKNWKAGGGWYGLKKAFFEGEKIAEAKAIDNAKDMKVAEDKKATQPPFPIQPQ